MTRTIYLIRHAMPDIPFGERWCVGGQTDLPLSELGRLQAALLPFVPELRRRPFKVTSFRSAVKSF